MKKIHQAFLMFGLVGAFLLLDIVLYAVAKHSYSGIFTENYYQKGIDYDKNHNKAMYDKINGWKITTIHNNQIQKIKVDTHGIGGAQVIVKIMSPVKTSQDQEIILKEIKLGHYEGDCKPLLPGQWLIRTKVAYQGEEFTSEKRVFIS
jgi:nitrogen fixation protein FixH